MKKQIPIKFLLQALGGAWYIEESAAYHYAAIVSEVLAGSFDDLFGSSDESYRVNSSGAPDENGEVLILPISSVMMKADSCGSMGTASMVSIIESANNDSTIASIVLKMDTPGGTVDGTEALATAVQNSSKPVVTWAEMMCSAGYWVGSSADEIILSGETANAGSIGTMVKLTDMRGLQEARGVKERIIFASRSADKNKASLDALDGKPEALITEYLDPMNNVFLNAVQHNRSGKINTKKEDVLTGKVYFGSNAVKVGLADKIASLNYAVKRSLQLAKTIQ